MVKKIFKFFILCSREQKRMEVQDPRRRNYNPGGHGQQHGATTGVRLQVVGSRSM